MSVHLHVGQCGNQLGAAYWRLATATGEHEGLNNATGHAGSSRPVGVGSRGPKVAVNASRRSTSLSRHLFHPETGAARCILVDSEPKVVRSVCEAPAEGFDTFRPAHTHVEQAGRGNNWAMGYYGPRLKAPKPVFTSLAVDDPKERVELVMDSLRREIETIDCYQGSVVMHSLGGGTGSGLGCRVLESMRDMYPRAYIVTASVAPSWTRGDSPLQNYNAVLTLQCLQEVADAVIYKDNDELLRTAAYWKALVHDKVGVDSATQRVSLAEVNSMVAADLAGLLFPVTAGDSNSSRSFDFGKFVHDVCPMPAAKMLDVRSGVWRDRAVSGVRGKFPSKTPVASDVSAASLFHAPVVAQARSFSLRHEAPADFDTSLEALERLVHQTAASFSRKSLEVLASSTLVRGFLPPSSQADRFSGKLGGIVQGAFPAAPWLAATPQVTLTYSRPAPFAPLQAKASATICVNNGHFLTSTKCFLERAQRQFRAGAYVHWYKQHGLEVAEFDSAFERCQALVGEYETLLR
jgi:hypothetical protein